MYLPSVYAKNNNNNIKCTQYGAGVLAATWIIEWQNNPFVTDVKKTINLTRAYDSDTPLHVTCQYFSIKTCDVLKYKLAKACRVFFVKSRRLFVNCICSIFFVFFFIYGFWGQWGAVFFNRNNNINGKHRWSVKGTLTNVDYFSRELKLIIKNYQCSWVLKTNNTENWKDRRKLRVLSNKNWIIIISNFNTLLF